MKRLRKRIATAVLALAIAVMMLPTQNLQANDVSTIHVNQTYTKSFENGGEGECMYRFTAPKNGYFHVELTMTERDGENWRFTSLSVFNSANEQILETIGDARIGYTASTNVFATKAGNVFYFKLKADPSLRSTTVNFKVVYTNSENWENEYNDSAKTACALTNNRHKYGIITCNDRYDYYKMNVTKASKVKFTFGPKEITGDSNSWDVEIINSKNNTTFLFTDVSTVKAKTVYLKKGTYYLRVRREYCGENVAYKLKYQLCGAAVSTPVISKVNIKKYKNQSVRYLNSITFSKNGYVDGYQVQVAKNKNMSGKYINQKVERRYNEKNVTSKVIRYSNMSYLKKDLKSKKITYYVRVRSYVLDPFGNIIYGNYSKIKSIKK